MRKATVNKKRLHLKSILRTLRAYLPELQKLYGVKSLGVFGSYVHGGQRKRSDLDILVDFECVPTLFKFVDLQEHLRRLLGIKVDLVMKSALKPAIGERILSEVVPV
ncbi:MAG TPA: nucleotidyltransferase family protein [Candidatus Brocadiia bacterium]|nr:nucleotidyltransferase family protein [Planctomycetota bacterium]MDO8092600.1 nucleotidyltransferase family protein [Candidatus Brocadiales bacterium]